MSNSATNVRIGVYVGKGASHSWTWFVDILEREQLFNLCFPDEHQVKNGGLADLGALLIAGGDTYDLAEGLGQSGSRELTRFIANGGCYIGSCAGAYLMLRSSKQDLNLFNYVKARVNNHVKEYPAMRTAGDKPFWYRCRDIFHPVRDEVTVRSSGVAPFFGNQDVVAPLFGGPIMIPSEDAATLATYSGFTGKTMFLVEPDRAREMVLHKAAVVKKEFGDGSIYLFGPHFEHPRYPAANRVIVKIIQSSSQSGARRVGSRGGHEARSSKAISQLLWGIKAELSNARIVAIALQRYPLSWPIGIKTYAPPKILHFLETMWTRVPSLFRGTREHDPNYLESMVEHTETITRLLRTIKSHADRQADTLPLAVPLFPKLKHLTARFLEYHFQGKLAGC